MVNVGSVDIMIQAFSNVEETVEGVIERFQVLENWQKGLLGISQKRINYEQMLQKEIIDTTTQEVAYQTALQGVNMTSDDLNTILTEMTRQFKTTVPVIDNTTESMGLLGDMTMRQTMGFLGLMFFTQRLAQSFSFLNDMVYQNFLAGEMMNLQWELFAALIPVIDPFLQLFYDLLELFYELPEEVRIFVAVSISLFGVFLKIASSIFSVIVALGAFKTIFPAAFADAVKSLGTFLPKLGAMIPGIGLFVLAATAMFIVWRKDILGIFGDMFRGIQEIIKGNTPEAEKRFELMFMGISVALKKFAIGLGDTVATVVIGPWVLLINSILKISNALGFTESELIDFGDIIMGIFGSATEKVMLQENALIGLREELNRTNQQTTGFSDGIDELSVNTSKYQSVVNELTESFSNMGVQFDDSLDNMTNSLDRFVTNFNQMKTTTSVSDTALNWGGTTIGVSQGVAGAISAMSASDWLEYFKSMGKIIGGRSMFDMMKAGTLPMSIYKQIADDEFWFQHGGVVPGPVGQPVPIIAHAGETVVPAGHGLKGTINFNPTVNISATVKEEADIKRISEVLMDDWKRELRRMI